tara:strand:- start:20 stop:448 length:429 start_codon:yes stop_codon:yes gene_type:complete
MKKVIIYTNETCPYCKRVKEELTKNKIKFENRLTKDFQEEWGEIIKLTGMPNVPCIKYDDEFFSPQRDFGNPQGLINLLKNFKKSKYSESRQILEALKTLNINIINAFGRLDNILRTVENKLNTEKLELTIKRKENEHKSTD